MNIMCEMKYSHNILWDVEGSRVQLGLESIALGVTDDFVVQRALGL